MSQYALLWKAKIYLGMERYQEVLDLGVEARRENVSIGIEPPVAVAYARLGHWDTALRIAEGALREKQSGAEIAVGHVYFEDKEYELALQFYEDAARHKSERAAAMRGIGKTLICLGDYPEACAAYEAAIRLTPFVRPDDLLQLAKCLRHLQQERAAVEMEILAHEKE
ncbi:MAG: domain protein putative component of TonB system [Chthonomonadales bacterium]|nr:domain protein putative component of TonB system [Chthonomonadales bacterium]